LLLGGDSFFKLLFLPRPNSRRVPPHRIKQKAASGGWGLEARLKMDKDEQAGNSSAAAAEEECAITNFAAVCTRHRHSQYTGGGQTLLCSRPSDGRTEFIGSVRRNQKPLRWIGLALPPRPLDAFENRSPRNTLDIRQKSKEILTIFHPLVPRTTRYSSIWPKYKKLFIYLAQVLQVNHPLDPKLQAIHPLGSNVQSIPPLGSNVQRNSFNFGSQMFTSQSIFSIRLLWSEIWWSCDQSSFFALFFLTTYLLPVLTIISGLSTEVKHWSIARAAFHYFF
jgi:hypothetical protein